MVDEPLAALPQGIDADAWEAACYAVRAYCGWHVAPSVSEKVTVDGSGGSIQLLPTLHLTDLEIINDGTPVRDPEWSRAGMVRGSWTRKFRGVEATMQHGYAECPPEIVTVLREMIDAAAMQNVSQVTNGAHTVRFDTATLNARQRATLDRYRIPLRP